MANTLQCSSLNVRMLRAACMLCCGPSHVGNPGVGQARSTLGIPSWAIGHSRVNDLRTTDLTNCSLISCI